MFYVLCINLMFYLCVCVVEHRQVVLLFKYVCMKLFFLFLSERIISRYHLIS